MLETWTGNKVVEMNQSGPAHRLVVLLKYIPSTVDCQIINKIVPDLSHLAVKVLWS